MITICVAKVGGAVRTMSRTLEEAIEHAEDIAVSAIGCECREEHRQLAAWLRELQERRKAPEIITCGECVNFAERDFCKVAGHNVHRKSNCMQVFGAERRTE